MAIDRAAFFATVRASFGALKQGQVDGFNAILDQWEARGGDDRHLAYMLATAWHETARTVQPIKEMGGTKYFTRMYDIKGEHPDRARLLGNLAPGDGARYCGRGYVQLTGMRNYAKAGSELDLPLVAHPDLAMNPGVAARIMFAGMAEGWFTGKKLSDYEGGGQEFDAVNARRIINGTDRAKAIAGYYRSFLVALLASHKKEAPIPPLPDIEPIEPQPSFWARLLALFSRPAKEA
jgi:putative chitinase